AAMTAPVTNNNVYVQVGAFGDRSNAERRLEALSLAKIDSAFIHEERSTDRVLYRVRIGPVADVVQYDVLVEELENIGIADPYLITD
ncbi:MAG: SPOR domain-containing protein, partial [Gammaproteobacteria bacterium]|nr:SPOR domain-containing protein [Gammaproteobacteria bacterium]